MGSRRRQISLTNVFICGSPFGAGSTYESARRLRSSGRNPLNRAVQPGGAADNQPVMLVQIVSSGRRTAADRGRWAASSVCACGKVQAVVAELVLRFVPSYCEGWPEVTEVVIHPYCLEFQTAGEWKRFPFE